MTRSLKTLAVAAATATAALALSTSALAAFGGHNTATGGWSVTAGPRSGAVLSPDGAAEVLPFTIVNNGRAIRVLHVAAAVRSEPGGDAETTAGADIRGCRAGWLRATVDTAAHPAISPGSSYMGQVTLRMLDSGSNQDACENAVPAVEVSAG